MFINLERIRHLQNRISQLISKFGFNNAISTFSLLISIGALTITLTTFYYQFWRVNYDLKATIISICTDYKGSMCVTDVIFTNAGNKQCAVAKITLRGSNVYMDSRYNDWSDIDCYNQTPFTVSANNVVTKRFLFGDRPFNFQYKDSKCSKDPNCMNPDEIVYSLSIVVVDSEGKCHEVLTPIIQTFKKSPNEYNSSRLPVITKLMPSPAKVELFTLGWPQRLSEENIGALKREK